MIDWNETRQRRFLQILILNLKSFVDVEGLNIWGKWGKKFVSPQSAFLVLPENSPYLKKKQSCNQNISSTWLEIRCTFVVDVNIC